MMPTIAPLLETIGFSLSAGEKWTVEVPSCNWITTDDGIWRVVANERIPAYGWKVHVSAILEDAPNVLAVTSGIAFRSNCSFKFLAGVQSFLKLHFKNESRLQSGKFIALYPPNEVTAREVMEHLCAALTDYRGLDILTDRAYKSSSSVFYRWAAFSSSGRLNNSGEPEELIPDGHGNFVPDIRLPYFSLPEGIVDPFIDKPTEVPSNAQPTTMPFDQFTIESVLRFTNAGGRYSAVSQLTGTRVVIKEARPHTGYVGYESAIPRLRREAKTLKTLSSIAPKVAPELMKEFAIRGHEYIAMEYIEGTPLSEWIARENPLYSCLFRSPEALNSYFDRAATMLDKIKGDLVKLHACGVAYGDLSSSNVIVSDLCVARLIDFEGCTAADDMRPGAATPDFCLIDQGGTLSARDRDWYAYNCIAISFVLRITTLAELSDHVLAILTEELSALTPTLPKWWADSCASLRNTTTEHSTLKTIGFSPPRLDSFDSRAHVRKAICQGIKACNTGDAERLPAISRMARQGGFLGFSYGCSGVFAALTAVGVALDSDLVSSYTGRVERELWERKLPLGHNHGLSGMLDMCSMLGNHQIAGRIVEIIATEWTRLTDPSLGTGLTGVALSLARYGHIALSEEVMERAIVVAREHSWTKNGLLNGRSGVVAGACQFKSILRGHPHAAGWVRKLITDEFNQTVEHPKGHGLSLRAETNGTRLLPYLSDGTAGLLLSAIIANRNDDIEFCLSETDIAALSADLETPFMLEASLMDGAAGLAVVLEWLHSKYPEMAGRLPSPGWDRLRKFFLPVSTGIGLLNPRTLKLDLSYAQGSAGVLAALSWLDGLSDLNVSGLSLLKPAQ